VKYRLILTCTPLLHAITTLVTNAHMSKIEGGQLQSELLGHRHSTLQSHGLFALAKHLLRYGVNKIFGTHRLTHSQTDRPDYRMHPASFFNGGREIKIPMTIK